MPDDPTLTSGMDAAYTDEAIRNGTKEEDSTRRLLRIASSVMSAAAEGLQQHLTLGIGEVRVDELAVHAVESFADPVEIALLGDHEESRGSWGHLGADLLELLLGDAGVLGHLADRADRGAGHATDHGDEEEGAEEDSPESSPAGPAPGLFVGLLGGRVRSPSGHETTAWSMIFTNL